MVERVVHGPRGCWCSSGWPDVGRGAVVVVPAPDGGPSCGRGLLPSGMCGSPGRLVDPTAVVDTTAIVGPTTIVDVTGTEETVVVRSVRAGSTAVVADGLRSRSRSCRPTSSGVSGAGRAMVTSSATRWIAALTPSTISVVAATHVPRTRTQGPSTRRVCGGSPCGGVKRW